MAISERQSGIRATYPDTFRLVGTVPAAERSRRTRRRAGTPLLATDPGEAAAESNALLAALGRQAMAEVDRFRFEPTVEPAGPAERRLRGMPPIANRQAIRLSVPLAQGENAAILLEQGGLYQWVLPDQVSAIPEQPERVRRTRGGGGESGRPKAPGRVARFTIDVRSNVSPAMARHSRGRIRHLVFGTIQAFVLKFIAPPAVGKVVSLLEQHVSTGLVLIDDTDVTKWRPVDGALPTRPPKGHPARILLLVHGTFSSTVGGFAALAVHPWGREFLRAAIDSYDFVLGYDHRTLSIDPLENAGDLQQRLQSAFGDQPPQLDVVCHSRGGLVARSLIELLGPTAAWCPEFGRVVFVACTNEGTLLAEPENWHALVDLFTNLSLAATRALGLLPHTVLFAKIVDGAVQGVGTLVKVLVDEAVTRQGVPGLAAMEPAGSFVTNINKPQPGQPDPQRSWYSVASSDFKVSGPREVTSELPARFVQMLADGFMSALMGEPNDLVVNVSSMSAIDPEVGGFVDDSLDFGSNRTVYHTNYFAQPRMVEHLMSWLGLFAPAQVVIGSPGGGRRLAPPGLVTAGSLIGPALPASVVANIMVTAPDVTLGSLVEAVQERDPAYVVVSDPRIRSGHLYAVTPEEVFKASAGSGPGTPVDAALGLGPLVASAVTESFRPLSAMVAGPGPTSKWRSVVVDADDVLGVLPEHVAPPSSDQLVADARSAARSRSEGQRTTAVPGASRARRARSAEPHPKGIPHRGPSPQGRRTVTTHVFAEMPDTIVIGSVASIHVDVSREQITKTRRGAADSGEVSAEERRPLIIQAVEKANVEIVGSSRVEIPVPEPGDPKQVFFDVRGTNVGPGEVWVVLRQDQLPLLTLKLKPTIVESAAEIATAGRQRVDAAAADAPALPASQATLRIWENRQGDSTYYEFELDIPERPVWQKSTSRPVQGDRDAYVQGLYSKIEDGWANSQGRVQAFHEHLRALGGELLDELIPSELQEQLWRYRKQLTSIMVVSEEPFIPWELVHLKAPGSNKLPRETLFLGQLGLVRWLYGNHPPQALRVRRGKARLVIPDYPAPEWALPETAKEKAFLQQTFGAKAIEPHLDAVRNALKSPGSFDLLHFAGHGIATGGSVSDGRILLQGSMAPDATGELAFVPEYLDSTTVGQFSDLEARDGSRPVIVLNACQAGRMGRQLTSTGGFAVAFLKARAGAFVSSLWSVGDLPAREFTETFYAQLVAGKTIADATRAARNRAREQGDATWLAYVVYANPAATMASQ